MNTTIFNKIMLCLVMTGCCFMAAAQAPLFCGDYTVDTAALRKAKAFETQNAGNRLQATTRLIRIYFHVLSCDDGTFTAATTAQINSEFNTLVADYQPDNICFINGGIDFINNTKLDTNFTVKVDDNALFDQYRVANCINVFYLNKIKGNNPSCSNNCGIGGTSLSVPNTFCLISSGNIGQGQTISHEVGHCMGLLHTFETVFGTENINGSNSGNAGDQVTDTPADPYAYNAQPCFATTVNQCVYTGTCKDPNNASNFSPPYTNLMAYWWANGCYANLTATNGQYTRVNSTLNTNAGLQACQSAANVTESGIFLTSGFLVASAINTLNTSGNILIIGTAKVTFGGGLVLLEPGFAAIPSANGLTTIKARPCN